MTESKSEEALPVTTDETTRNEQQPTGDIDEAPAKAFAQEKPLPPNIRPSSPASEVIKLANSGLEQSVMLAFVTNSSSTFNLSAEEIIYLNDIGVPSAVVTAMIQRDQVLKNQFNNSMALSVTNSAPNPYPGPPMAGMMPPPEQVAPEALEASSNYPREAPPPADVSSEASFYDSLAPYGNWVDLSGYGWCWQPTVVVGSPYWQPYFDCGHWVYTDCGWYWSSTYSWGWAPFHYGRWFHHHHYGWCWAPDTVWGPSWVSWRYTDAYCGWAPLPPGAYFTAGVGLTYHGHHVREHDDCGLRPSQYHFVAWNHFHDHQLTPHRLPQQQSAWAYAQSTVANRFSGDGHTVSNNGLPPTRVANATHTPVRTVALRESTLTPTRVGRADRFESNGRTLEIYRPKITSPATGGSPTRGSRRSAGTAAQPGGNLHATTATPSMAREGVNAVPLASASPSNAGKSETQPHGNQPLILRGSGAPAPTESVPRSSLIIIGRKDASGTHTVSIPAPSTPRVQPTAPDSPAQSNPAQGAGSEPWQHNPPWLARTESTAHVNERAADYRVETPRYQMPARSGQVQMPSQMPVRPAPIEVPRNTGNQSSYLPQRSVTTPTVPILRAQPPETRSAPAAAPTPSAPAAPAASGHAQSSPGRSGR